MTDNAEEINETELKTLESEGPVVDEGEVEEEVTADQEDDQTEAKDEKEEEDGVVVTIGEDSQPSSEEAVEQSSAVFRNLRKQYRDSERQRKKLEKKLAEVSGAQEDAELGKKPTLESTDFDNERYERELEAWYERKLKHDEVEAARQAEAKAEDEKWQKKLKSYESAKSDLKVRDYEDAEEVVQDLLTVNQQGMIVQGADNPALLVYALGKNPKVAKDLSTKDPISFAFAVSKLETQLKVTKRKASSKPEPAISGAGRPSGSIDSTLERLRDEAEKTGDYTKVFSHKLKKKRAART